MSSAWEIQRALQGQHRREQAGQVFARFLDYLRHVELPPDTLPRPEMAWFVTG